MRAIELDEVNEDQQHDEYRQRKQSAQQREQEHWMDLLDGAAKRPISEQGCHGRDTLLHPHAHAMSSKSVGARVTHILRYAVKGVKGGVPRRARGVQV